MEKRNLLDFLKTSKREKKNAKNRGHSMLASSDRDSTTDDVLSSSFCDSSDIISTQSNCDRYKFLVDIRDKRGIKPGHVEYDGSTLYISQSDFEKMTPFEKQFWEVKMEYWDAVVFFKKGKFYELYEKDAEIAAKLFNFRITERVNMKMAGFPETSLDEWITKFLNAGYKVARVDQAENMVGKQLREQNCVKDKIIKRELKEVLTQGTVYDINHISTNSGGQIVVVKENSRCTINTGCNMAMHYTTLIYDASVSKLYFRSFCDDEFHSSLRNLGVEFCVKEHISYQKYEYLGIHVKPQTTDVFVTIEGLCDTERECYTWLYNYMSYLKREKVLGKCQIKCSKGPGNNLVVDISTVINMDIISNKYNKSLCTAIDYCVTPFGKRKLKKWLLSPLASYELILNRQKIVAIFEQRNTDKIVEEMAILGDCERLFSKLLSRNGKHKDLVLFWDKLKTVMRIYTELELLLSCNVGDYSAVQMITSVQDIYSLEDKSIRSELLQRLNVFVNWYITKYEISETEIVPGADNMDEVTELIDKKEKLVLKFDAYLREQQDKLKTANICYKNVGKEIYQLEVDKVLAVPDEYFLVSSTKYKNRYYTVQLQALINNFVLLDEKIFQAQGSMFSKAVDALCTHEALFHQIIHDLSTLDCIISFSKFNKQNEVCVPTQSDVMKLVDARNPIYREYVSNDYIEDQNILIITGPNMAGKSTFMRTVCLNVILFHVGLKVCAKEFACPVFDRIFSRIGASDNLLKGQSTFMVELSETSTILRYCTDRSFVVMDELGRGTSTTDGERIANAVLNYLAKKKCHVLFSTHYHNIAVDNASFSVGYMNTIVRDNAVIFLYKLVKGVCTDSNGINVARLAGVPPSLINLAIQYKKKLSAELQSKQNS